MKEFSLMQVVRVDTFISHPQWNGSVYNGYDIALARLPREIKNITCPSLPHEKSTFRHGTRVLALGWGLNGPRQMPDTLQMAQHLMILDPQHCPSTVKKYLKAHMLCAHSRHINVCKGKEHFFLYSLYWQKSCKTCMNY